MKTRLGNLTIAVLVFLLSVLCVEVGFVWLGIDPWTPTRFIIGYVLADVVKDYVFKPLEAGRKVRQHPAFQ